MENTPEIPNDSSEPGLDVVLQPFTDYKKKKNFKEHLKKKEYEKKIDEKKKTIIFSISGKTYDDYVDYFKEHKCITNREDMILKEEREECE